MNFLKYAFLVPALAATLPSAAETVLIDEDFDDDFTKTISSYYDADRNTPSSITGSLFYSQLNGASMPWWILKDTSQSTDRFMGSHSYYETPGTSNDWMILHPVTIPSEGFVLSFDAQSLPLRGDNRLSSLSIFITDNLLDVSNVPTEPTAVFEDIPYGEDPDICEGDWTRYSLDLSPWAGKTIYINFVNKNTDKDILCVDNIKVARTDVASLSMDPVDEYTLLGSYPVRATVTATSDVANWKLTLYAGTDSVKTPLQTWSGENLAKGEEKVFDASVDLTPVMKTEIEFVFECDGQAWTQTVSSPTTLLAFETTKRVLIEESTSLLCGNCPMATYNIEKMVDDPDLCDKVVPVSVHISALGYDPMADEDVYTFLPKYDAAPLVFVDRNSTYDGFIPSYDLVYNTSNTLSFAYRIARQAEKLAILDVDVECDWAVTDGDTTGILCKAKVRPAANISGEYRVAFILTENNVGLDNNPYWIQTNYLSGTKSDDNIGGWSALGSYVTNLRYHDVARRYSNYYGHSNSLPATMTAGEEYTFEYTMRIPDTYRQSSGMLLSEAVDKSRCVVTAVVIDYSTRLAVNSSRTMLGDNAAERYTAEDLAKDLAGITTVGADSAEVVSTEYFDINGRRLAQPAKGVNIVRQTLSTGATRTVKEIR